MEYKRMGRSGLQLSRLSFGSWVTFGNQIEDSVAEKLMNIAYDAGVNFFDNAETYANGKSEEVMGRILYKNNWERSSYVLSSKVFWGGKLPNQFGLSRKHIHEACDASLKRLKSDYLDLFFCHRPDRNTPIEETVRAMSDLVSRGKVLYWGTSEWSAQQITEAFAVARQYHLVPPSVEQPQYNLFYRDRFEIEYSRLFEVYGIGTTIWSPLASGLLTGKYNSGNFKERTRIDLPELHWLKERFTGENSAEKLEKVNKLGNLAQELDMPLPCLAIGWCLQNPNVSTVILGASEPKQLKQNLLSLEYLSKITDEVMNKCEEIMKNKPKNTPF